MSQKSAKRKKKRKNQLSNPSYSQSRMGEKPQRNHKDSTFCLLFSEPQRAIELYLSLIHISPELLPAHCSFPRQLL